MSWFAVPSQDCVKIVRAVSARVKIDTKHRRQNLSIVAIVIIVVDVGAAAAIAAAWPAAVGVEPTPRLRASEPAFLS